MLENDVNEVFQKFTVNILRDFILTCNKMLSLQLVFVLFYTYNLILLLKILKYEYSKRHPVVQSFHRLFA